MAQAAAIHVFNEAHRDAVAAFGTEARRWMVLPTVAKRHSASPMCGPRIVRESGYSIMSFIRSARYSRTRCS